MSLQYNNTTTKNGIIQLIERNCGFSDGGVSGDTELLAKFTGDVNLAIDQILGFMFPLGGNWQLDDANHTDYPIIFANLVSGQRDYTFNTDGSGNYILDIYRVMVADSSGTYREIKAVDQQEVGSDTTSFIDGQNSSGTPSRYDKTANGIFLDPIPDYNYTAGLKVFINREASYFTTSDDTKKLGFAHLFHEYLALRPSYQYAYRNGLSNTVALQNEMLRMEQEIKNYFACRTKDEKRRIIPMYQNNK